MVTVEVSSTFAEVDKDAWASLRDSTEFSTAAWVQPILERVTPNSRFWYVTIERNGYAVLGAALCSMDVNITTLADARTKRVLASLGPILDSRSSLKVLMCGTPMSGGQRALLVGERQGLAEPLMALDAVMNDIAADIRADILLYKEMATEDAGAIEHLRTLGYTVAQTPFMYSLPAQWRSFDLYLDSLRSHYRLDIRRSLRKATESGLRFQRLSGADAAVSYSEGAHLLYVNVVNAAEYRLELLRRQFFTSLAETAPEQVTLTQAFLNEELVGFNWSIANESVYKLLFCGLDYAVNRQADVYFNLMYEELSTALSGNTRGVIEFGQTADQFKARLGCNPSPRYVCVKARKLRWNITLNVGGRYLFPKQSGAMRRVFK